MRDAPKYEIRYFVGSHGSDSAGFVALPISDWRSLEENNLLAVQENFLDPRALPNIFTELVENTIPEPAKSRFERMIERNRQK
jgi:hypothetical protein